MRVKSRIGVLALLTGLAGGAAGVAEVVHTQSSGEFSGAGDYVLEVLFLAFLVGAGLTCLRLGSRAAERVGRAGWIALAAGFGLLAASATIAVVTGKGDEEVPLGFLFVLGVLVSLLALVVLAAASLRGGVSPRWLAPAVLGALLGSFALQENGGVLLLALPWLALGAAELRRPT
jgi:hypothetical protein